MTLRVSWSRLLRSGLACGCLLWGCPAVAQTPEPIRYTVSVPAPHRHYIEVNATVPTDGRPEIELMMAVWTPGSYLVREYSRHVEALTASDPGRSPLRVQKTRKNRWRIATNGASRVSLRYLVYANEMSVRTNFVDTEFALLNGAATFITLAPPAVARPHEVRLAVPSAWAQTFSGMNRAGDGTYIAPDYDTLVDSPIVAGNTWVHEFAVRGTTHYLVNFRERGAWNRSQSAQDLAKVVEAAAEFWQTLPFERFYFFNVIGAPVNALEHRNSTVILTPRDSTNIRESYVRWLSTAAHEYFHAWNVKRLRPIELGPFDYENEVYTEGLWFAEGVTDYYADLLLARSGVITPEEHLALLSAQIRSLQTTPGRLEQSLTRASLDAWIKYYRPDENSANTAISYYVKGAVTAFLLDAKLRRLTGGEKSLDDVMRLAYSQFSGHRGFRSEDIARVVATIAGPVHAREAGTWLQRALESTDELDYGEALEWFGLRLGPPPDPPSGWIGLSARADEQRTIVSHVRRGSPADAAQLSVGDEITSIDGQTVAAGQFAARVASLAPGTSISLSITRHDQPRDVTIGVAADPGHRWTLAVAPSSTSAQRRNRGSWMGPRP